MGVVLIKNGCVFKSNNPPSRNPASATVDINQLVFNSIKCEYICDQIYENPACHENSQVTQCAFLVLEVENCQSPVFVIHVKESFY